MHNNGDELTFELKRTSFFGRECMIICQNKNGPCPLLAIANVLLLQKKIEFNHDRIIVLLSEIVESVANLILESQDKFCVSPDHIKLIESTFNILPKLSKGLDLNVFFTECTKFEFTEELSVFDSLGIPLLHGWIVDPADSIVYDKIKNQSYNHLLYKIVEYRHLKENNAHKNKEILNNLNVQHENQIILHNSIVLIDNNNTDDDNENFEKKVSVMPTTSIANNNTVNEETMNKSSDVENLSETLLAISQEIIELEIFETFLQQTASQLTPKGLLKLYELMHNRQLAIFFRNNHFSVLFCFNGQIFVLVTDEGFYLFCFLLFI
jgi:hypothetical protein